MARAAGGSAAPELGLSGDEVCELLDRACFSDKLILVGLLEGVNHGGVCFEALDEEVTALRLRESQAGKGASEFECVLLQILLSRLVPCVEESVEGPLLKVAELSSQLPFEGF